MPQKFRGSDRAASATLSVSVEKTNLSCKLLSVNFPRPDDFPSSKAASIQISSSAGFAALQQAAADLPLAACLYKWIPALQVVS